MAAAWRRALGGICVLMACLAAAEPAAQPVSPSAALPAASPPPPGVFADARLDIGYALSTHRGALRDDAIVTRLSGVSPAHVRLSGAAFLRALPLGVAADFAHERYAATGPNLVGEEEAHRLRGARGTLALVGRLRPFSSLALEGQAGYGFGLLPVLDVSQGRLRALSLPHHGPLFGGGVLFDSGGPLLAQLSARLMPAVRGARSPLGEVRLAHGALGAQLGAGGWRFGGARWHAMLDYALEVSRGAAGAARMMQRTHRFGVGLRASFGEVPGASAQPRPDAPRALRGRVTLGDTGGPAEGVQVAVAGGPHTTTDAQGVFTFPAVGPGPVLLTVRAEGYRDVTQTVAPSMGDVAEVALVLTRATVPGHIRGTVLLSEPGGVSVPAEGLPVESPGGAAARTGPDGAFLLGPVGPGPVQVTVRAPGRKEVEEVVAVPTGGEAVLDVVLERVERGALASLRGEVHNAAGRPVVGATLRVPEAKARARADQRGRFHLHLPAGRYSVVFSARGYVTQTKVVEVAEGDQAIFHIRLVPQEP